MNIWIAYLIYHFVSASLCVCYQEVTGDDIFGLEENGTKFITVLFYPLIALVFTVLMVLYNVFALPILWLGTQLAKLVKLCQ